jgi:hypothetical protein
MARYSVYLLSWYKSTNTDASVGGTSVRAVNVKSEDRWSCV